MSSSNISNAHGEKLDFTFHAGRLGLSLVVLGHGVTGNKDRPLLVALAEGLSARGWPCLRVSFSGNGKSDGKFENSCITKGIEDLQAVLAYVPEHVSIAYVGHSMGGAVGVLSASRDLRIRTLVTIAGMAHTAAFVKREFSEITPGQGNMWDEEGCPLSQKYVDDLTAIDSILPAAASVHQPWLMIHGTADDVIPLSDGQDTFNAATSEKKWFEIPGAGHSFDESSYPMIIDAIDQWLTQHLGNLQ